MAFRMTISLPQNLVDHISETKGDKSMAAYLTQLVRDDKARKEAEKQEG